MRLADELTKLDKLRRSGALSEAEFEKAKAALLIEIPAAETPPLAQQVSAQLAEVKYQNELARIDREWAIEREQYMVRTRYGTRTVPTSGLGVTMAIVAGVFGALWTIMAFVITNAAPDVFPFSVVRFVFPLFGLFFIVFGIGFGIHTYRRAKLYEERFQAYQSRRHRIQPEDSR